jgi:hypothetical protein
MLNTTSFWEHPLDKLEKALHIRKQIAALENELRSMFGGDGAESAPAVSSKRGGRRTMSATARAKIAAAQRARWAKSKGATTAPATLKTKKKRKRSMSPEAKAKIAAAQKERWARVKGAKAPTAAAKTEAAASKAKKKRNISPEGRAKMVEAGKRRWAKKKATKAPTAKSKAKIAQAGQPSFKVL